MSTPVHAPDPQLAIALPEAAAQTSLLRRVLRNPLALGSIFFLAVVIVSAVAAPLLAPHNPNTADISAVLSSPDGGHLLGTDGAGRDVLSRLLFGAQFSLAGALVALVTSMLIGVTGGLLAGYYGKWIDTVSTWVISMLMALPAIIVLLAARAVVGPSLWASMLIFGVMLSPAFFRLVYASVSAVRNELYVDAARVSGLSDRRIIGIHILTVVRAPIVVQSAIVGGVALAVQSGLEFLGLGDINVPTWGQMLSDGFTNLYTAPLLIIWPALAIGLTLISLTLLANSLRDELERSNAPRKRRRKQHAEPPAVAGEEVMRHDDGGPAGEAVLRIENLSVGYETGDGGTKRVVHDVSLTVARGEVHGLVGESGSGKTQTAWSALRLLPEGGRITGGSIFFHGDDLAALNEKDMEKIRGSRIAYIPQEPMSNLDPSFTIGSQLVEPMRICLRISKKEATDRALALLARVGIPNPERTFAAYPHQVSGGMAQRVLIAGAISCNPDLLIADEPTTALDVTVQAEVLDLLRDLQSEFRMAVILVTHNFGVVADLCDRVSVMRLGRIVETGPTRSIFTDPRHPYTRELLGAILGETSPRGPLATFDAGPSASPSRKGALR
ncbi:dipeptide/oligopeptide/nickel ABC transporter permease/ATP-binding protein [Arthrobacter sp. MMS18-M83]|uniref:dipeptide/oligopeptide/nickel ABC transporter permease/ATP-binding protein n=1 Tax=Arthrobacter sp. MMS18-M83 TaxID=2996261 RepID=UPI00227BD3B6|nr:dipeptide/oligopeptide/nickel ABC transporter permease/ATP-binding protein [Arthrobacter sp. MMS18-M83]WAH97335.1 dipeptide/oligopeptide/nickel ABC transporter permease/ATP-binding protein [Arthrobacter sp. MMS18-M83]WAH97450.1 dipeptide/oligopeptide/nickel ABC transporter permease/ATP-binding protein [Arthrobacter sp. MMS18-M83]